MAQPPSYRQSDEPGKNCGTCQYFYKLSSSCRRYNYKVSSNMICRTWKAGMQKGAEMKEYFETLSKVDLAFHEGFIQKCAELGLDPEVMLKVAVLPPGYSDPMAPPGSVPGQTIPNPAYNPATAGARQVEQFAQSTPGVSRAARAGEQVRQGVPKALGAVKDFTQGLIGEKGVGKLQGVGQRALQGMGNAASKIRGWFPTAASRQAAQIANATKGIGAPAVSAGRQMLGGAGTLAGFGILADQMGQAQTYQGGMTSGKGFTGAAQPFGALADNKGVQRFYNAVGDNPYTTMATGANMMFRGGASIPERLGGAALAGSAAGAPIGKAVGKSLGQSESWNPKYRDMNMRTSGIAGGMGSNELTRLRKAEQSGKMTPEDQRMMTLVRQGIKSPAEAQQMAAGPKTPNAVAKPAVQTPSAPAVAPKAPCRPSSSCSPASATCSCSAWSA